MSERAEQLDTSELSRIKERIDRLAERKFLHGQKVYYLSTLGTDLGDDKTKIQEKFGLTLLQFIERHTSHRTNRYGVHKNVYGLIPEGVDPDDAVPPIPARKRYKKVFWAAFIYSDGTEPITRYINLVTFHFDANEELVRSVPGEVLSIEPEYQVCWSDPNKNNAVHDRIASWLKAKNLSADQFYEVSGSAGRAASVLEGIIAALNTEQLQRVSIPLDVIAVLLKKRS